MAKKTGFNVRTCSCGAEVIAVRCSFTHATFDVQADPVEAEGFRLEQPGPRERNARAIRTSASVYLPHAPFCDGPLKVIEAGESSEQTELGTEAVTLEGCVHGVPLNSFCAKCTKEDALGGDTEVGGESDE